MNSEEMKESEDFFDAEKEGSNLCCQDSNSSFDVVWFKDCFPVQFYGFFVLI